MQMVHTVHAEVAPVHTRMDRANNSFLYYLPLVVHTVHTNTYIYALRVCGQPTI